MKRAFLAYGLTVVSLYAGLAWAGWEPFSPRRGVIPAGVRQAPGGYRSYGFWRGGK